MDINHVINEEMIIIGDKVDVVSHAGEVFRTMIEDKLESGLFLAGVPNRKGVFMHVDQDDDLYLVFYRETGRYIAHMKVVAIEKRGAIRYMWLVQKAEVQRNQRREAFRLQVSFEVQVYEIIEKSKQEPDPDDETSEEEVVPLEIINSRDISVTGISIITKKKYMLEENYQLNMHFNKAVSHIRQKQLIVDKTPGLQLTATVKRCIPWRTANTFNTGMKFYGMTDSMSDGLARYVLAEQQRQLKKRNMLDY